MRDYRLEDDFDHIRSYINKYPGERMYFLVQMHYQVAVNYDGPHDTPEGVAKALKLIKGIFPTNPIDQNVMVTIEPVPDLDVDVDKEAMEACAMMVRKTNDKTK
jgi:hypothetical protein